ADRPLLRLQDDGAVVRPNVQLDAVDSERAALLGDATAFDRSPRQAEQRAKNAVAEEAHPAASELSEPGEEGYGALTSSTVRSPSRAQRCGTKGDSIGQHLAGVQNSRGIERVLDALLKREHRGALLEREIALLGEADAVL